MARYIDEKNLIRRMHTMAKDKNYPPYADIFKSFAFKVFKDLLMSEPTADVQEVKHAFWNTKRTIVHDGETYCSECEYETERRTTYCPNCGARMDGKEN